jgi:hypothetical protein
MQNAPAPPVANRIPEQSPEPKRQPVAVQPTQVQLPQEIDGPRGPEPTRYGDWERKGRCIDF